MSGLYHRPNPDLTPGVHPQLMMRGTTSRHSLPAESPSQSRKQPRSSEPALRDTVSSKELRKCWICYDDEEAEGPSPTEQLPPHASPDASQLRLRRKWVKPCRCSLVAHESCLLTWITTYQLTHAPPSSAFSPLSTPVSCPQCSAIYTMTQPSSHLLTLIHRLKRPYDKILSWSALGCVLLGIGVTTSCYGLWASRCFLGPSRWNRWVFNSASELGLAKLFQLSFVGPVLILSRTSQLDSVLPFLPVSLILSDLSTSSQSDQDLTFSVENDAQSVQFHPVFPPNPALTLCLIPWARIGWNWVWSKVTYMVLAHEYKSIEFMGVGHGLPSGLGLEGGPRPVLDPNPIGRQEGAVNGAQEGLGPNPLGAANGAGGVGAQLNAEVVLDYTTLRGAIRIGLEALILPGAASIAGNILLILSRNLPWLRTILGIRTLIHQSQLLKPSSNSIWSRFTSSIGINKLVGVETSDWKSQSLVSSYSSGAAEDPIWWRNTLGGVLIVLVRDVMGLVEKVLKIRKLSQRRILDAV